MGETNTDFHDTLDQDFLGRFNDDLLNVILEEYPNIDENELSALIDKFFDLSSHPNTQEFLAAEFGVNIHENHQVLYDMLMWISLGHVTSLNKMAAITPLLGDVYPDDIEWNAAISKNDMGHVSAIESPIHCPLRRMVFGPDGDQSWYGYKSNRIYGNDVINSITLHDSQLNLLDTVALFTNINRVDENGYLDRISTNILVAPSGIVYELVPIVYPAWQAANGNHYDFDYTTNTFHSLQNLYNYNNQTIHVTFINDGGYTAAQLESTARLFENLLPLLHKVETPYYATIRSADEIDSKLSGVNGDFAWDLIGIDKIDNEAGNILYNCGDYSDGVLVLRNELKMYGMPVTITGDDTIDGIYDQTLATYARSFAKKHCNNQHDLAWHEGDDNVLKGILRARQQSCLVEL